MLKHFCQFGTLAAIIVLIVAVGAPPAPAGKGGGKGGGNGGGGEDPGNVKVPSIIDFADGLAIGEDGIAPTNPYIDEGITQTGQAQVEAFIGSQANTGAVFLRTWRDGDPLGREIAVDLLTSRIDAPPYDCEPPATATFVLPFMEVDVDDEIAGGLYGITTNNSPVDAPMRLRLKDNTDPDSPFWFLYFGGGDRGCRGELTSRVDVSRVSGDDDEVLDGNDVWEVVPTASNPIACLERWGVKKKPEFCGLYNLPFSFTLQAQPQP